MPSRSMIGSSFAIAGVMLIVSAFLDWGHISNVDRVLNPCARISLSGFSQAEVTLRSGDPTVDNWSASQVTQHLQDVVPHPGPGSVVGFVFGLLALGAAVAYLRSSRRTGVAIGVGVIGSIGFATCLYDIMNVPDMFNDPPEWSGADYSPGIGLIIACIVNLALVGLGIMALVLERR